MAAANGGAHSNERNKNNAIAGRLSYLRSKRFETQGFGSNEPVPSLAKAREMHGYNLRLINGQRPMPSVSM